MKKIIFLNFIFFLMFSMSPAPLWAAGAAAKRRQGGMQQQRAIQQQQVQQEMIKRRAQMQRQSRPVQTEIELFREPPPQQTKPARKPPAVEDTVVTMVTLSDIWASLDQTSHAWSQIIDDQAKEATVTHYMIRFRQQGITIRRPPAYYVQIIDSMSQNNPGVLSQPFQQVLQAAAIIEYDFDNGQDKDTMARQLLSEKGYIANKKRLGLQN